MQRAMANIQGWSRMGSLQVQGAASQFDVLHVVFMLEDAGC